MSVVVLISVIALLAFFLYSGITLLNRSAVVRKLESKRKYYEEKLLEAETETEILVLQKKIAGVKLEMELVKGESDEN